MALLARRRNTLKTPRNTAPLWKKLTIVVTAVVAVVGVMSVLDTESMNVLTLMVVVVAVIVAAVWLMAKLLGVRLSLHSWD